MCRWQTYFGPPIYLEDLIYKPEHSLIDQSQHSLHGLSEVNADGVGIGWYGDRPDPGRYRQTRPAWNDANLRNLSGHIKSGLFFAHIRASTGTSVSMSNCHPFVFNKWMFMHNGSIAHYSEIRRKMEALIPDSAYACRLGTTDSEAFFLMMFAFDIENDPVGALRKTISSIEVLQREQGFEPGISMTAALSNGEQLIALRYAANGSLPPSLYWEASGDHQVFVSEPFTDTYDNWTELPPGHVIHAEIDNSSIIEAF